ncbi:hypothetical protein [Nocardia panacis]|uniref:hypothetical protein n=1 Tax=Nocardia panacis TaxID=2340916 RepID=UPI001EEF88C6|nr:hypothetical protein [Nocardia panacis]
MAPLYDLSTAMAYEPRRGGYDLSGAAMSIGGRRKFGQVIEKNWIRHAHEMGMDPGERLDRAAKMAAAITDLFRDELADLGKPGRELADHLLPRLSRHAAEIVRRTKPAATVMNTPIGQGRDALGRFSGGKQSRRYRALRVGR